MIRNYLTACLRSFKRNIGTTFINVLGLAFGLACCLVSGLYIKHEFTADSYIRDLNLIHRVSSKINTFNISGSPYMLVESVREELPDVQALRTLHEEKVVTIGDETFRHNVVLADPNFFEFFSFPLKYGAKKTALAELRSVVIGTKIRDKYFPDQDPTGKIIQIQQNNVFVDYLITAVADQTPSYSSIQFDFLIPLENHFVNNQEAKNNWSAFFITTFMKVEPDQLASLEEKVGAMLNRRRGQNDAKFSPVFNALSIHHLSQGMSGAALVEGRSANGLYVFTAIALVILLLACFNFMNLTNAQSARRVIEVGVRKVIGARKSQLVKQFLLEAIALGIFAALIALGIAELSLFFFRDLLQADLSLFTVSNIEIYVGLAIIAILSGCLAGFYPALVLSNLSAIGAFKRFLKIGGTNLLTRSILTIQFCLSIILVVAAIVMWQQQNLLLTKNLGYDQEHVLVVPFSRTDTASVNVVKEKLRAIPEVVSVSKSSAAFTKSSHASLETEKDGSQTIVFVQGIDEEYIPTMKMELVNGKNFDEKTLRSNAYVLVNEALVKKFNLKDSIGIQLGRDIAWIDKPTIIGVVKDFHHAALRSTIEPLIMTLNEPSDTYYLMVRIERGKITTALEKVRASWETINVNSPFEYFFLDDEIQKQYESEMRWSEIITLGTCVAIFLSILGLVGLALFTAEQRKKEISIRKVLGASIRQIITLLSKEYLVLIIIAFLLSIPVSYYVMTNYWLSSFAYHIEVGLAVYAIALVVVLLIVASSIGSLTVRAATQNPADTLKEE